MIDRAAPDRVDFEGMMTRLTDAIGGPDELKKRYRALDFELFGMTLAEIFRTPGAATIVGLLLIGLAEREVEAIDLAGRVAELEAHLEARAQPWDHRRISNMLVWLGRDMGLSPQAIRGPAQDAQHFTARQAAAWVAQTVLGYHYTRIGRALGGRDHTTIMSSVRRAETRRQLDPDFKDLTDRLRAAFEVRS